MDSEHPIELDSQNEKNLTANMEAIRESNIAVYESKSLSWGAISGLFVLLLLYLVVKQQPKRKTEASPKERRVRAEERAWKRLSELPSTTSTDAYYVAVTSTVREYIEECFALPATTQTTEEFLHQMSSHPLFDQESQKLLADFLLAADQVKFAEREPSSDEREVARDLAKLIIKIGQGQGQGS